MSAGPSNAGAAPMDNFMSSLRTGARMGSGGNQLGPARLFNAAEAAPGSAAYHRSEQRRWQMRLAQKKWGSSDAKRHVLERVELREYGPRETIVQQGDDADAMFFAVSGELDVVVGNKKVHVLRGGDFFGEYALLHKAKRTATIVTRTKVSLRVLAKRDFEEILHAHPKFEAELRPKRRYVMDMVRRAKSRIRNTILYRPRSGSTTEAIMKLALTAGHPMLAQQRFMPGDTVVQQGEDAEEMYFVLSGQLEVMVSGQKVHTVKEGAFFGEYALLHEGEQKRTATVRVAEDCGDCVLWRLGRAALRAILLRNPEVADMLDHTKRDDNRQFVTAKHVAFQQRQQQQLAQLADAEAHGDLEMYTIENLMKRAALQDHPLVVSAIRRFWRVAHVGGIQKEDDDEGDDDDSESEGVESRQQHDRVTMSWEEYKSLNHRMQRALVPGVTQEEVARIAVHDWKRDMRISDGKGQDADPIGGAYGGDNNDDAIGEDDEAALAAHRMSFAQFADSLFELADIWCEDIDGVQYAAFLDDLLASITAAGDAEDPQLRKETEVECVEGWMRRKFSVAIMHEIQMDDEAEDADDDDDGSGEFKILDEPGELHPHPSGRPPVRVSVRELQNPNLGPRASVARARQRRRTSAVARYEAMTLQDKRSYLEGMAPRDRVLFWDDVGENERTALTMALPPAERDAFEASVAPPPAVRAALLDHGAQGGAEPDQPASPTGSPRLPALETTDVYWATTGGRHRVMVKRTRRVDHGPAMPQPADLNPVAAHYGPKDLLQYILAARSEAPFDAVAEISPLVTTPSRWRRSFNAMPARIAGERFGGPGTGGPGFGLARGPGGYVAMTPGRPARLPAIVKRTHFAPINTGIAGHLERREMAKSGPAVVRAGATGFSCSNLGVSKVALHRTAQFIGSSRTTETAPRAPARLL